MASIRKRGDSYLITVSMGYDFAGKRRKPQQKTVHPPKGRTTKQTEKWLNEQAVLFEMACKKLPADVDRSITLEQYINIWLETIAQTNWQNPPWPGRSRTLPVSCRTWDTTSWWT